MLSNSTRATLLITVLALAAPAAAQGRGGRAGGQGGVVGRGVQRPARDQNRPPDATGTALIAGRVVAADTGRPLKRARVIVAGGGRPRVATTDEQGRYRDNGLPSGSYTITATKTGFVDAAFGQRRALRTGTPIQIADGQQIANADVKLPRGGVVTGHVADEDGEPLARALVTVLRYQWVGGEKRLAPAGSDQSDDRGQYRVFGLPPGDYVVSANAGGMDRIMGRFMEEAEDGGESTGYAPTYYPGVTSAADAIRVKLATALETGGIDFQLQLVPLATVRGTVSGSADTVVLLVPEGGAGPRLGQNFRASVAADRTFAIRGVPPGRYTAVARGEGVSAVQNIVVSGADLAISLVPAPAAELRGTITLEAGGTEIPKSFSAFRVVPLPLDSAIGATRPARSADVAENGSFVVRGLMPGRYAVRASGPRGWILKAVYANGRDITDDPVDIKTDNVSDLNLIFTDRISSVGGTVRDARGAGVSATTVIVFPADAAMWTPQSRRIQTARTDQGGAYQVSSLPSGDYFVVATDDVEQGEWFDPEFLDQMKEKAVRVTLGEGEQRTQDLKAS
jgi:sarcosine oxidase gamma subunit